VIDAYVVTILTLMTVWSIVTLGLNVITGLSGQFNLGVGVYMGTGAYASAMLTTQMGFSFWEALPISVAAASLAGFVTGLPALRVREDSLAVLTIGLVFVFESLLVYLPYFGGPVGISKIPRVVIANHQLNNEQFLLVALGGLVLAAGISLYIKNSWLGLALESVREDEHATNVIGVHPAKFKLYAFAIGGGLAGLGGVLYAHSMRFISPYDFGFMPSVYVLVMLVFGGIGTIRGAVFGAVVLTALPEVFRAVQDYRNLMNGIILILMMLYQPNGLLGRDSVLWLLCQRMVSGTRLVRATGVSDAQHP
jgi:branched-chain amino acid transport system permease protein